MRALWSLMGELVAFAVPTRSWWMLAMAVLVVMVMALSTAASSAVPVAVYAFF